MCCVHFILALCALYIGLFVLLQLTSFHEVLVKNLGKIFPIQSLCIYDANKSCV